MMIEIRRIDAQHKSDINIPNEAFPVFGRIIPSFNNGHWTYKLERYHPENITEITFPNKDYVYEDMEDSVFLGAYDGTEGKNTDDSDMRGARGASAGIFQVYVSV